MLLHGRPPGPVSPNSADLVLNVDPFTCPPEQLPELPDATMVNGEWVYQKG
jgi:predicted amidohydrolase YtcJ